MNRINTAALAGLIALAMATPMAASDAGRTLFEEHCVRCHGEDGTRRQRSDLTGPKVQEKTDRMLLAFISDGRGHMFSRKAGLKASQVQFIVDHLRTLRPAGTEEAHDEQPEP